MTGFDIATFVQQPTPEQAPQAPLDADLLDGRLAASVRREQRWLLERAAHQDLIDAAAEQQLIDAQVEVPAEPVTKTAAATLWPDQ